MFQITDKKGVVHGFDSAEFESKLLYMDCMDAMKSTPDKYFDLAIVDP